MNLKKLEQDLNDLKDIEKSIEILPEVLKNNINHVETYKKAIDSLNDYEKKIIQRICIDKATPYALQEEFRYSVKKIYLDKNKALKKLHKAIYGQIEIEGDK